MPGPSNRLLRIARAGSDTDAVAWLANPKPSQLVDDLDTADLLRALERLGPEERLADAALLYRSASSLYRMHKTAGGPTAERFRERCVALYVLVRRSLTEIRLATGLDTETGAPE